MKKETIFELNGDYRIMEDTELAYMLTGNLAFMQQSQAADEQECSMQQVLEEMPPFRRKVALAAIELYKRKSSSVTDVPIITSSQDTYDLMLPVMENLTTEEGWVILLNNASKVIRKIRISCGSYSNTPMDVRIILREALLYKATSLILCHNHPSGNTSPSKDDDWITQTLCRAADQVGIIVVDHLIISNDGYFSFGDANRM